MIPKGTTLMFLGRSGSGKDTQIEMLMKHPEFSNAIETNTGNILRKMATKDTILGKKIKWVLDTGGLMPGWLSFSAWLSYLIKHTKGDEILFASGSPRRLEEAELEDRALEFLGRPKPVGVHVIVSREAAKKRLLLRERHDDTNAAIDSRQDWFENDVMPIVEFYKKDGRLIEVNGEQTPEEVFRELEGKIEKYFSK
jgi:adenylate kinase